MCLYIDKEFHKDLRPKVAKENIVCYKVLRRKNRYFITPEQHVKVNTKKEFVADFFEKYPEKTLNCPDEYGEFMWSRTYPMIHHAIHTYKDRPIKWTNKHFSELDYVIMECIIPKNTLYWVGCNSKDVMEYASEKIRFIRNISKDIPYAEE